MWPRNIFRFLGIGEQTSSRFCIGPGKCEDDVETLKTKKCSGKPCPMSRPGQGGIYGAYSCFPDCNEKGGECEACNDYFADVIKPNMSGFCCSVAASKYAMNGNCTPDMISKLKESEYGYLGHHMCIFQKVDTYGPWSEWSACSASCGGGTKSRDRVCDGDNCAGEPHEEKVCNTHYCPIEIVDLSECTCKPGMYRCWSKDCDTTTERCELTDIDKMEYKCKPKDLGECKAWGDPHLISFDQQLIDVYGVGKYVFSTSESSPQKLPYYGITMETSAWGEFSVVKVKS